MRRIAATRVEVLLVTVMLATLALIILPGLTETRERARRARCLTNLRNLAAATHAYANEDSSELLIPIHRMTVSANHAAGWTGTFTPMPGAGEPYPAPHGAVRIGFGYSYGGRTATTPISQVTVMMDPDGNWGARTRPLNPYVVGSTHDVTIEDSQSFACPADTGYPLHPFSRDVPQEAANIPCFDLTGNSYRIPIGGYFWTGGPNGGMRGHFSISVFGKSRSSIQQTDRLMLLVEPMTYCLSRAFTQSNTESSPTWHGEAFSDQAAMADGSARLLFTKQFTGWSTGTLSEMNVATDNPWFFYLRKNTHWTTDAYPTPGTLIRMRTDDGTLIGPGQFPPPSQLTKWPYLNYTVIN